MDTFEYGNEQWRIIQGHIFRQWGDCFQHFAVIARPAKTEYGRINQAKCLIDDLMEGDEDE